MAGDTIDPRSRDPIDHLRFLPLPRDRQTQDAIEPGQFCLQIRPIISKRFNGVALHERETRRNAEDVWFDLILHRLRSTSDKRHDTDPQLPGSALIGLAEPHSEVGDLAGTVLRQSRTLAPYLTELHLFL